MMPSTSSSRRFALRAGDPTLSGRVGGCTTSLRRSPRLTDMLRGRLRRPARRALVAVAGAVLALALLLSAAQARILPATAASPASGHAQVIAQGVAELPEEDLVWRAVERQAAPREDAEAEDGPLGFVVAGGGEVIVAGEERDRVRLAPGEATFVAGGETQERVALGERAVTYVSLELVDAAEAADAGDGTLIDRLDPFAGSGSAHDLDLVRDVLAPGETGALAAGDLPGLLLVTDGTLEVEGGAGEAAIRLRAGEAIAITDDLTLANAAADDGEDAVYLAAVIGPAIAEAAPVSLRPTTPSPAPSAPPAATGSLTVTYRACPDGMRPETLVGDVCGLAGGGAGLQLIDSAGRALDPVFDGSTSTATWRGLSLGTYELVLTRLPGSVERVSLESVVCCDAAGGWSITLSATAPNLSRTLYHFPFPTDSDGDRLSDRDEIDRYGTDPGRADTDGDGLTDGEEILGDGLRVAWDPLDPDMDRDGLLDGDEYLIYGTDPTAGDSDADGLLDGDEIAGPGGYAPTDPLANDTDGDGLRDGAEVTAIGTDPTAFDSDLDGLGDGDEVNVYGTGPLVFDSDSDTLSDGEEISFYATDPFNPDTDGDLLLDGDEAFGYWGYFTDPGNADTDTDGLFDGDEVLVYLTDPTRADMDGDGFLDGHEVYTGTNPFDPASHP